MVICAESPSFRARRLTAGVRLSHWHSVKHHTKAVQGMQVDRVISALSTIL